METHTRLLDQQETPEDQVERDLPKLEPMVEYQQDPEKFMVDKLGIPHKTLRWSLNPGYDTPEFQNREWTLGEAKWKGWDGTPDPLIALLEGLRDGHDVCVEAGTGTQKSYTAAAAILWFLACFYEARVYTFAPKEEQLRSFIWMEINKLWPRFRVLFPTAIITDLRIRMRGNKDDAWSALGYAVGQKAGEDSSTKAQGMHAPHMMLVYEETPGIPLPVIEAGENTSTDEHNIRLALGNPDHQLDALHLFGHDEYGIVRPRMRAIRISGYDHPNVVARDSIVPGAVSQLSIDRRRIRYGTEHRMFRSRVRGISPAEAASALIKLEWIQRAQKRWEDEKTREILEAVGHGARSLGVDVANSEDGDEAAISDWKGAVCLEVPSFPCPNSNNLGYDVFLKMREHGIDPNHVGVDGVGVGAGTVNELRNRGAYIRSLTGGQEGSLISGDNPDEEEWNTLRSQMWWTLAEDLKNDRIALPKDVQLAMDLITPTWKPQNGKVIVESKEDIKKRTPNKRSPNKADAVVYGNYVRPRDPVTSSTTKNVALTTQQRLLAEMRAMDDAAQKPKRSIGLVMRQG